MAYKVVLISPITKVFAGVTNIACPALSVWRMAAYLKKHTSADIEVWDADLEPLTIEAWRTRYPDGVDMIGISVLNDTLINTIEFLNKLGKSRAFVVCGGAEATLNYQEIFDRSNVPDAVVLGEGEKVMGILINGREGIYDYADILGLILRKHAEPITNDDLWKLWEPIDFSVMGYEKYWKRTTAMYNDPAKGYDYWASVRLVTSTHCPRNCSFCSVTLTHDRACGKKVAPAFLSAQQIGILIDRIKRQVPTVKMIYFCEDDILLNATRTRELIPIMKASGLKFMIQTFANRLTDPLVEALADAGCFHITCGVESPIPRIREAFGKPQSQVHLESIIEWCAKYKVECYYLIILFAPYITYAELIEAVQILQTWRKLGVILSVEANCRAYRGTRLWDSDYDFTHRQTELESGTMRIPDYIYPKDIRVRYVMDLFNSGWPEYKTRAMAGRSHEFKGATGSLIIDYVAELLGIK
jgi:radical SAM superfamily enzyme YgiQ (UPF0313 family)